MSVHYNLSDSELQTIKEMTDSQLRQNLAAWGSTLYESPYRDALQSELNKRRSVMQCIKGGLTPKNK